MIFEKMDHIVFAGDSITDMGCSTSAGNNLGDGYVRTAMNMIYAFYPETPVRITNAGISGNTSRDLLARWDRDILDQNPDYVSICIGGNDVWRQFDMPAFPDIAVMLPEYESNLREMIRRTRNAVKKIFILSPYYMEPLTEDPMRAKMDVDLQEMFDKYFAFHHSSSIAWDRIHPNGVGATLIAREFLKHCNFDYNH